jgi:hypothetical protein
MDMNGHEETSMTLFNACQFCMDHLLSEMFMKDANALTGDISTSNAMAHKQVQHLH